MCQMTRLEGGNVMQFIFQYPDVHGTDGDMLDAGPVAELAVAAETIGMERLRVHRAPGADRQVARDRRSPEPRPVRRARPRRRGDDRAEAAHLPRRAAVPEPAASLAKSAATVDKLSNGRFILGVGTGYLKAEYFALGVDFDERNALFDEALDVLPLHWSGEPFDYQGTHFNCRGTIGRPRPVQIPIPIWIGGNAKLTLRRVAERAQGWMPLTGPAGDVLHRALAGGQQLRRPASTAWRC